ncbi:hypothetical protein [Croceicoccus marinus]|uniref:hypothetical protein n=1 Tax=Croceicoccus marinus TaxID=450378 RepID=UPI0012FCA579|nr:hypothetical protein [Croceicoccus marinus]
MRDTILLIILSVSIPGCSEKNLFDRRPSSDRELKEQDVGFGWNGVSKDMGPHYVGLTIHPNDRYEFELGKYRSNGSTFGSKDSQILRKYTGMLRASDASELRRELARLEPPAGSGYYATIPGCPYRPHSDIEYYVAFGSGDKIDLAAVEKSCATGKAAEARHILNGIAAKFRKIDDDFPIKGVS